jgi:hypothetical protein
MSILNKRLFLAGCELAFIAMPVIQLLLPYGAQVLSLAASFPNWPTLSVGVVVR